MTAFNPHEVSRVAIGDRDSGLPLTRDCPIRYPERGKDPLPLCLAASVKKGCRGLAPCSGRRGRQPRELPPKGSRGRRKRGEAATTL